MMLLVPLQIMKDLQRETCDTAVLDGAHDGATERPLQGTVWNEKTKIVLCRLKQRAPDDSSFALLQCSRAQITGALPSSQ